MLDLCGVSLQVLLQWLFLLHLVHQSSLFHFALQFLVLWPSPPQAEHSCIPQRPSQSVDMPESLAVLELLSWLLERWYLSAMFLHLLLLGGLSLGQAGQMFAVFVLLFPCAICVSHCWTSSRVLVLCCSLGSKFTVWCGLSAFWPVLTLIVLLWPVGSWFVFFLLVLSSGMSEPS